MKRDYKKLYIDLKTQVDDFTKYANEIFHGHIKIKSLNIDYNVPSEVISYHHWINRLYIFIAASLLGSLAVVFARSCDGSFNIFKSMYEYNRYIPFLITPVGLVALRWLTENIFKGSEGSGVPQVIAAMDTKNGSKKEALSIKAGIGKLLGTNLALLCGASVGREGPTVQFGAIILRRFSRVLKAPMIYTERSLILAGGAAGVSAAFNTPIAGIVFAIEELGKSFYEKETSVLLMAIVVSGLAALSLSGPYFYFGTTISSLRGWEQAYAIPIGLVGGLLGGLFSLIIIKGSSYLRQTSTSRRYFLTFCFGLLIAGIGFVTDGATFGTGYDQAKFLLEGTSSGSPSYPIFKFFATAFSYFSGIPGGVFAPTLSIGAGIGNWFVNIFDIAAGEAFVLFGMVAFFAGVIRSPITAVIIVSEMTHNHTLLLPLLLASLISLGSSKIISKNSLYQSLADIYRNNGNAKTETIKPHQNI